MLIFIGLPCKQAPVFLPTNVQDWATSILDNWKYVRFIVVIADGLNGIAYRIGRYFSIIVNFVGVTQIVFPLR